MEWIVEAEALSDFVDHGRYTIASKPLVRCKDCIHRDSGKPGMVYCQNLECWVSEDFFCKGGERRE